MSNQSLGTKNKVIYFLCLNKKTFSNIVFSFSIYNPNSVEEEWLILSIRDQIFSWLVVFLPDKVQSNRS